MRSVRRCRDVQADPETLWSWLGDLTHWNLVVRAFGDGGWRHELASGPRLGPEAQVRLTDAGGKEILRWKVVQWEAPRRMSWAGEIRQFLAGFRIVLSFDLDPLPDGATRASASLSIIFRNTAMEMFSFLLPTGFLYGRVLDRVLDAMESGTARAS